MIDPEMLSVEECRKHLEGIEMTDEEVVKLRGFLYKIISELLDNELQT